MIRLSKRGWNNVLIFATLLLILLFHQSGEFFNDTSLSQSQTLLPEDVPVMKIEFGTHTLERIGQGWRIRPGLALSEAELSQLVDNWQQVNVTPASGARLQQAAVVVIWLAGQSQGRIFELVQQGEDVLVQHQGRIYHIPGHSITAFIPKALL